MLTLLAVCAPMVSLDVTGSAGGMLMITETVTLSGDGGVGTGDIVVTFDVIEVEGGPANATVRASIVSGEGEELSVTNLSVSLNASEMRGVSLTLQSVPPGLHQLRMVLTGEVAIPTAVGSDNGTDLHELFIRRHLPLSLSLAAPFTIVPLDGQTGLPSGNTTLRDGDSANISVAVTNEGEVAWNGSWVFEIDDGEGGWIQVSSGDVSISWDDDGLIQGALGPLSEGVLQVRARLIGLADADPSDNSAIDNLTTGPPAGPRPHISLIGDVANASVGDQVVITAMVTNDGDLSHFGNWSCGWVDGTPITNGSGSLSVDVGSATNLTIIVEARPGTLRCTLESARSHADATLEGEIVFDLAAASFTIAGSAGIALTGSPAHVGDTLEASVLVHNSGEASGSAFLVLTRGADGVAISTGAPVTIDPGSSREVTTMMTLTENGSQSIDWRIGSQDGFRDGTLNGTSSFDAQESQSLDVSIAPGSWTLDTGLSATVTTTLSEGRDRLVTIETGHLAGGSRTAGLTFAVLLSPGSRTFELDLDHPASSSLYVEAEPVGWTASANAYHEAAAVMPTIAPSVESLSWSTPTPNGRVTLTFDLVNGGNSDTLAGEVVVVDAGDGAILAEVAVEPVGSRAEEMSIVVDPWPTGSTVDLRIEWRCGDGRAELVETISNAIIEESLSATLPVEALAVGIIGGLALGLAARLLLRRDEQPKGREGESLGRSRSSGRSLTADEDDKREVTCPSCSQALRVPSAYAGRARCPACSTEFSAARMDDSEGGQSVEKVDEEFEGSETTQPFSSPEEESEPPEASESDASRLNASQSDSSDAEESVARSKDDLLSCPECSQRLRITIDKRPTRARCPACRAEFRAEVG